MDVIQQEENSFSLSVERKNALRQKCSMVEKFKNSGGGRKSLKLAELSSLQQLAIHDSYSNGS